MSNPPLEARSATRLPIALQANQFRMEAEQAHARANAGLTGLPLRPFGRELLDQILEKHVIFLESCARAAEDGSPFDIVDDIQETRELCGRVSRELEAVLELGTKTEGTDPPVDVIDDDDWLLDDTAESGTVDVPSAGLPACQEVIGHTPGRFFDRGLAADGRFRTM